jgi:hypothetical protein
LPPGAAAAAVCTGFGFFALRANPGVISSNNTADNVSDESANRGGFNCENVDREKLDLGFMELCRLSSRRDSAARSPKSGNSGPSQRTHQSSARTGHGK